MTLRQLALSNMSGLRRKYAGFLFSSMLSVLVFYLLASFVLHPDVVNGYVAQAERVRAGLKVSQWIIVIFTLFFVMYSSWAFVKSRKKEFGLLCLLGATRSQVSRLVMIEHAAIGFISVATGLGLGIPGSKLMLDAMSRTLQVESPVRFMVVMPAVGLTVALFMSLFVVIGAFTTLQISPRRVVRLLREHQQPKALPTYSPAVAALAFLCIGGGYAVAWTVNGVTLVFAMFPVTFVVSFGTFLFFAQASVALLRMLQRKVSFVYKGLNLLTVGDLIFRMKENAWVLATVAVLSACVITSMGTIYTAQATLLRQFEDGYPHAVTFAVNEASDAALSRVKSNVLAVLSQDKVAVTEAVELSGILIPDGEQAGTLVISEPVYNKWASAAKRDVIDLQGSEAAMLQPYAGPTGETGPGVAVNLTVGGKAFAVEAKPWPFAQTNYLEGVSQFVVVDGALFEDISEAAPTAGRTGLFSYEFKDWKKTAATSKRLRALVPDANLAGFSSRMDSFEDKRQMTGLTGMIALFVTVLFFIGAGSMLYFRLFGEIQEDREKYRSMRRLGISPREINRVVTAQILVIFFAPITVGAAHCMFAMKSLSNVLRQANFPFLGVFTYALASLGMFTLVQVVYFLIARSAYIKEIGDAASAS